MLSYSIYRNKKSIKWVTFIHGAGGSSAIWFKQVRVFSKFFNVLLIDLRGHGNSKSFIKSVLFIRTNKQININRKLNFLSLR